MERINMLNPERPTIAKSLGAQIDYGFKWARWLAAKGRNLASFEVTANDGLTKVGEAESGGTVTVVVAGGSAGTEARLTCKVTTDGTPALIEERSIWLRVVQR